MRELTSTNEADKIKEAKYNGEVDGLAVIETLLDSIKDKTFPFQYGAIIDTFDAIKNVLDNELSAPTVHKNAQKKVNKIFALIDKLLSSVPEEYKKAYVEGIKEGITNNIVERIEELRNDYSKVKQLLDYGLEGRDKLINDWTAADLPSQVKTLERKAFAKGRAKYNIPENYNEGEREKRFKRFTTVERTQEEVDKWNKTEDGIENSYPLMLEDVARGLSIEVKTWQEAEKRRYKLMAEVNDSNKSSEEIKELIDNYKIEQKEAEKELVRKLAGDQQLKIAGNQKEKTDDYEIVKAGIITKEQAELFNYHELNTYDNCLGTHEEEIHNLFYIAKNYYPGKDNKGIEELASVKYDKIYDLFNPKLFQQLNLHLVTFKEIANANKIILGDCANLSSIYGIKLSTILNFSQEHLNFIQKITQGTLKSGDINDNLPKFLLEYALLNSTRKEQTNLAKELINKNININIQDNQKLSPLMKACLNGNIELIEFMLKKGANAYLKDINGDSVLSWAVKHNKNIIKCLLNNTDVYANAENIDLNIKNTLLLNAAAEGDIKTCETMLAIGANINIIDQKYKKNTLQFAIENNHIEAAKFFIKKGVDVNSQDASGKTPLITAALKGAENNNTDLVKLLVLNGAHDFIKDNKGMDVYRVVERNKNYRTLILKTIRECEKEAREAETKIKARIKPKLDDKILKRIEDLLNDLEPNSNFLEALKKHRLDKYIPNNKIIEKAFKENIKEVKDTNVNKLRDLLEVMSIGEPVTKQNALKKLINEIKKSDKFEDKFKSKVNKQTRNHFNNKNNSFER
jgi:ankyrin repeat protein